MQFSVEVRDVCGQETEIRTCGSGRPILYLHSGDGIARELPFLNQLASLGSVIAPSHPGFGKSRRPDDFKSIEDLAYFYLDFLKVARLLDVTIIGSSFGGWIACEIAMRSTEHLRDIVLIDTVGARFSDKHKSDIADIYMLDDTEYLEHAFFNPEIGKLDIANSSEKDLLVHSRNRVALCQYAWSPYMHNPRLERWLHRIDIPALCIWGAADRIVDTAYGRHFASQLPHCEIAIVENAGHFPQVEQPAEVMHLLNRFLKSGHGPAARLPQTQA